MVHEIRNLRPAAQAVYTTMKTVAPKTAPATTPNATPDFRALFTGKTYPAADEPPQPAAPTAESVFGPNPWLSNPQGKGPNGTTFNYNPHYFASRETAAKVAEMVGGTVFEANFFTPTGGTFAQQQPNYMVRLADGRVINPGLVASFYTHGYPQSYIDRMVAAEITNA
jgi:hypothetical protein